LVVRQDLVCEQLGGTPPWPIIRLMPSWSIDSLD
jgi:hypothetical protein